MKNILWNDDKGDTPKTSSEAPKLTVESVDNHIYFYAYVDSDRCLAVMRTIRELDNTLGREHLSRNLPKNHPQTPIWLHINSGGGSLFDALAVADQIQRIETPIYSVVEGYSASAATLLSMSCTKRFIQPSAFMLIHQLSSVMWGKYEEFKDEMNLLDMAMETLIKFYVKNSKLKENKIRKLLQRDSWFDADECIKLGLADKIL